MQIYEQLLILVAGNIAVIFFQDVFPFKYGRFRIKQL